MATPLTVNMIEVRRKFQYRTKNIDSAFTGWVVDNAQRSPFVHFEPSVDGNPSREDEHNATGAVSPLQNFRLGIIARRFVVIEDHKRS